MGGSRWLCVVGAIAGLAGAAAPAHAARLIVKPAAGADGVPGWTIAERLPLGMVVLDLPDALEPATVARELERTRAVEWAEPERTYRTLTTDPRYPEQWALPKMRVPEAWSTTLGSPSVTVGVVDSGIRAEHPDLRAAVVPGFSFVGYDTDTRDRLGHGTHVAGVIAAARDDGVGIAGIAPGVRVMPIRIFGRSDETTEENLIRGLDYAGRRGLRIVNASLGGWMTDGVRTAVEAYPDTLFVFAAGNDGREVAGTTSLCGIPAENVLCVAASDPDDRLAAFSNRGWPAVDVAAPGVDIVSDHTPPATLFAEGFGEGVATRWTLCCELTARSDGSIGTAPGRLPAANAEGSATLRAEIPTADEHECRIAFDLDMQVSTGGFVRVDYLANDAPNASWDGIRTFTGTSTQRFETGIEDLDAQQSTRIRFVYRADDDPATADRVKIDNLILRCESSTDEATAESLRTLSGTSMAAPQATGVAALLLSRDASVRAEELAAAIRCGSAGTYPDLVAGRVDAPGALGATLSALRPRSAGRIQQLAGNGNEDWQADTGPDATELPLPRPYSIAAARDGGFVVAGMHRYGEVRILRVRADGSVARLAGSPAGESWQEGRAVDQRLGYVDSLVEDPQGGVLFTQLGQVSSSGQTSVWRVGSDGVLRRLFGGPIAGFTPDGGSVTGNGSLVRIVAMALAPDGSLVVLEAHDRDHPKLRRIDRAGRITTIVADSRFRPAAYDADGRLWGSEVHRAGRLTADATFVPVAGNGRGGMWGDGGPALAAGLGVAEIAPADGGAYILDGRRVRRVDSAGFIDTVLGDGSKRYAWPGDLAVAKGFGTGLADIAVLLDGRLVAADVDGNRVVAVSAQREPIRPHAASCAPQGAGEGPASEPPANEPTTNDPAATTAPVSGSQSTAQPQVVRAPLRVAVRRARLVRRDGVLRLVLRMRTAPGSVVRHGPVRRRVPASGVLVWRSRWPGGRRAVLRITHPDARGLRLVLRRTPDGLRVRRFPLG